MIGFHIRESFRITVQTAEEAGNKDISFHGLPGKLIEYNQRITNPINFHGFAWFVVDSKRCLLGNREGMILFVELRVLIGNRVF